MPAAEPLPTHTTPAKAAASREARAGQSPADAPAFPESDHDHLRRFLAANDAACPVCGYGLRGVTSPRCPECNAGLRLTVGSRNLRLGPYLLAVISFALALGFDGIVSSILGFVMLFDEGLPARWEPAVFVLLLALLTLACAGGLLLLLRRRRAWLRRVPRRQWRLAIGIFIAVGCLHAALGGWYVWVMS